MRILKYPLLNIFCMILRMSSLKYSVVWMICRAHKCKNRLPGKSKAMEECEILKSYLLQILKFFNQGSHDLFNGFVDGIGAIVRCTGVFRINDKRWALRGRRNPPYFRSDPIGSRSANHDFPLETCHYRLSTVISRL